jgi:hypothetical protein
MWIHDDDVEPAEARGAADARSADPASNTAGAESAQRDVRPELTTMELTETRPTRAARTKRCVGRAAAHVVQRGAYWMPVFAPMVLFGQVALLGLRPALCERARLAESETALRERYERDAAQHEVIRANLRARQDPIFLERQRRWLCVAEPPR